MKRKLLIVDVESEDRTPLPPALKQQIGLLSKLSGEQFFAYGRQLDTPTKARAWLMDKRNWFPGQSWIVRWEGLVPRICENHGQKLYDEPCDMGIPEVVVVKQVSIRAGARDVEDESVVE